MNCNENYYQLLSVWDYFQIPSVIDGRIATRKQSVFSDNPTNFIISFYLFNDSLNTLSVLFNHLTAHSPFACNNAIKLFGVLV